MKWLVYFAAIAAMISSAFAGTRMPFRFQCPMRHCRNTQPKRGPSIGQELVGFWVKVDTDTGVVNGVTTTHSTGHSILDKAAEKALYRWKFPPGVGAGGIIIPVTFTTKGLQISYGAGPASSAKASK